MKNRIYLWMAALVLCGTASTALPAQIKAEVSSEKSSDSSETETNSILEKTDIFEQQKATDEALLQEAGNDY